MNLNCSNQDPCPVILDSKCVIYEGENLLYIGVNTNDNFRVALQQINTTIGNLILSGGITQLTGDVSAYGPGVAVATLATVNANVGQFGSSTAIPKITVNAKGLVTAISTESVLIPSGSLNFIGDVTGSGNTGSNTTLTLATVNSNIYTSDTFLKFSVNGKGLVTAASAVVSGDITAALGYTPYNASNPAGYISGITSSDVTIALGYTPYNATNPSNFISKLALSASAPLSYNNSTGDFAIQLADATHDGYLSDTDWNTFNNKQASGNYITDLSGEASATGPGSATVTLSNAAVTGKVLTGVNITGGSVVDTDTMLTAFGKLQNQINSLIGSSIYKGTWNAATNTPTLISGVGTQGWYYIVNVYGTTNLDGVAEWHVGDWAIFDGTAWQKVDTTDAVVSVNGFTGAVSLTTDNISEGTTNKYFTNTRARQALSAGTGMSYDDNTGIFSCTITQYTDALARTALSAGSGISYDNLTGTIANTAQDQIVSIGSGSGISVTGTYPNFTVTSTITQYTDALARGAISLTTTGTSGAATYNNTTGILNIPSYTTDLSGYVPTSRTLTINGTTYDLSADRSWTVSPSVNATYTQDYTATTGQASFAVTGGYTVGQLAVYYNGSKLAANEYTATNGTSFTLATACQSNDIVQAVASVTGGGMGGSGTTNYIPKFTASGVIGNSLIFDNGTNVGIGTSSPSTIGGYRVLSMLGGAGSILELKAGSGATSLIYSNNVGLNLTAQGSLHMLFLIDFVEKARLNNNGTFSIGNTNSTYKLDVTGTGRFTDTITAGAANGNIRLSGATTDGFIGVNTSTMYLTDWTTAAIGMTINLSTGVTTNTGNLTANGVTIGASDIRSSSNVLTLGGTSEVIRITSAGNVGIGTTGPNSILTVSQSNSASSTALQIINSSNASTTTKTAELLFQISDTGNTPKQVANIIAYPDGVNVLSGGLTFGTRSGDANPPVERMRLISNGKLLINTTTDNGVGQVEVNGAMYLGNNSGVYYFQSLTTSNIYGLYGYSNQIRLYNNTYGVVGYFNDTTGAYTQNSDSKLKKNIVDSANALDIVSQIKVRSYDWKATDVHEPFGIIAQELYEIAPSYVSVPIDDDSKWGVSKSELVPMLIKSIQELKAEIEELKAKIN